MRRAITALLGFTAAVWTTYASTDVTVMAVRLGADDVAALAKFYESAFGLKEIDRVGDPVMEIIMRYGATVAEAKAGASPEFLVQKRATGAARDPMQHAIFRVTDMTVTLSAAKAAGATLEGEVVTVPIGGEPIKVAMLVDPAGNAIELMELPKGSMTLKH